MRKVVARGPVGTFQDERFFETEDGATRRLKGTGTIQFDERRGVVRRDFRATYQHYQTQYKIMLQIVQLSDSQVSQLVATK